jgi:hypothetical protein
LREYVKGHGQHYNTREGRIWKKETFKRGKKDESILGMFSIDKTELFLQRENWDLKD